MGQWGAYATEMLRAELNSTIFKRNTLLLLTTGRAGQDNAFRPGAASLLADQAKNGSRRARALIERMTGNPLSIKYQTGKQGGGAHGTRTGNTPTVNTVDIADKAQFGWTELLVPYEIPAADMSVNSGPEKRGQVMKDVVASATEDAADMLTTDLFTGFPSSQSVTADEYWTSGIGLKYAIYDGSSTPTGYTAGTHKYYGGKDRSSVAELRGNIYTGAKQFSFSLIDEANETVAQYRAGGIPVVLVNTALFYNKVIKQAKKEGHQIITSGDIPRLGLVGFQSEAVMYRTCYITHDPGVPAGTEGGTSMMFGLDPDNMTFEVHPDGDFNVSDPKWAGVPLGNKNAYQGVVRILYRFALTKPKLFANWVDVS